jgi:hypothetical protein
MATVTAKTKLKTKDFRRKLNAAFIIFMGSFVRSQ